PAGERGVEIADVPRRIDREEARGRVVEIVDRVLEALEGGLVAVAVARHVGYRPHRRARVAAALAERAHAQPQPARGLPAQSGDAHLLLEPAALARRLDQPVDRLRDLGIAEES